MELPPGVSAQLTQTEARLLHTLRSHPGRVFTRAELASLVMPDAIVSERTIDVHIHALRAKLGGADRSIQTIRGRGYTYIAAPSRGAMSHDGGVQ